MNPATDDRTVLTLDAGGTTFAFHAIRGNKEVAAPVILPSRADDLQACLATLVAGFEQQRRAVGVPIQALSFAFPGPTDYAAGIIGDLPNLPAFRGQGGVALGPMLADRFGVPVYMNNDGDLFAYGEALAGFLPEVNAKLAQAGSPKRFRNLLGVTFGTGFGAGIVRDGRLFLGDNSAAAELWCTRHKLERDAYADEGATIRAVKRVYAEVAGLGAGVPEPKEIAAIAQGLKPGHQAAAREAFRRLGEVAGDAIADAVSLVDGLVVLGGGLSGAWPQFLPALMAELNGTLGCVEGPGRVPRTELTAFNLMDEAQLALFLQARPRLIEVPGSGRRVPYDPVKRIGVGVSSLGAGRAVALGAYAFALEALDRTR